MKNMKNEFWQTDKKALWSIIGSTKTKEGAIEIATNFLNLLDIKFSLNYSPDRKKYISEQIISL